EVRRVGKMFRLKMIRKKFRGLVNDQAGTMLVYAMTLTLVMVILGSAIAQVMIFSSRDAYGKLHQTQALYLAEAGIMRTWKEFRDGATNLTGLLIGADGIAGTADDGVLSFGTNVNLGEGNYSVVIADNDDGDLDVFTDVDNVVLVISTGSIPAHGTTRSIRAYMQVTPAAAPANVRAAIVTAGPVKTLGNLTVDGRNHDMDGNLIPATGMPGISTMQACVQKGNSKVGGTDVAVDYAPSKPGDPLVIETNVDWTAEGGFPDTPDQFMGLPPDTLKSIAQSGNNGSQYVTDPSLLTFPLAGVTYVELPSGEIWQSIHFGDSSGVIVVHNDSKDAIIKNLNTGSFKGILIADDIVHIHCDIIGVVISLTPAPSAGNCIGNGSGDVLYSAQAISTATQGAVGPVVLMKSWFN
ncbi:MAG: hypothetical protein O7E52_06515, partial [Candidatus Poribacteria bacterium]|nr:hypothetical protein [Candidatus Poribacteria bacterium]